MTANAPIDLVAADRMWREYLAAHPESAVVPEQPDEPAVERFGDSAELTDALLALVLDGTKTATSALVAEYRGEAQPLPRVGSHWIACDSAGRPRAVLRSVELRVGPMWSADEAFAADEGEDDRSLASWRVEHERYWRRSCDRLGIEWSDGLEVVFERFAVVWPARQGDAV
ncbi:ASCH domain-containing protein [Leifsonia sp. PS1209]|uniref:ASCH domain-containing protein n=1 Tax=Leifsonia sp. PS1209 TaxID=2724914 RepID=UPI001442AC01|nr:ASCH domain-containing protein [Leifsonia sp. PS1209]QIZ97182.1 ASCH domain-containing protein [Leifsonia sp. PS1209]